MCVGGVGKGWSGVGGKSRCRIDDPCFTFHFIPNSYIHTPTYTLTYTAAAKALLDRDDMDAEQIAKKAMEIAAEICVYTNNNFVTEVVDGKEGGAGAGGGDKDAKEGKEATKEGGASSKKEKEKKKE